MRVGDRLSKLEEQSAPLVPEKPWGERLRDELEERQRACPHLDTKFYIYGRVVESDPRYLSKFQCLQCGTYMPIVYWPPHVTDEKAMEYVDSLTQLNHACDAKGYGAFFSELVESGEMLCAFHPVDDETRDEFLMQFRQATKLHYVESF